MTGAPQIGLGPLERKSVGFPMHRESTQFALRATLACAAVCTGELFNRRKFLKGCKQCAT